MITTTSMHFRKFGSHSPKKSMKKLLLLILLIAGSRSFAQLNISLASHLSYGGTALANIGGYVDSVNNEYALVGTYNGLDIVNVTDPVNPIIVFSVPGVPSDWREVKTWGKYAYVTTEGGSGLQIVNLSQLPSTNITYSNYTGDGAIAGQIDNIHSLHIDAGYAYLNGSNLFSGATLIVSLANPTSPVYLGRTPGSGSNAYVHDCFVSNDTLWACHIYPGYFAVYDVSNKSNPVLLGSQTTPGAFTHNCWLNDAHTVLFTTDEVANSFLAAYDITDLGNIRELDREQVTPGSQSIIHNTHTINDYEVVSWYKDGVAIYDVARPDNMILVGQYDTYPQGSGNGFNGCWGVYPFLPSGNLVASDIDNGLYVLAPTYVRGCYLEGIVTDSVTGALLNNVTVTITGANITKLTNLNGEYKTGYATAGTYSVQVTKAGYFPKTITGVSLSNGVLTNLNVQLVSIVAQVTFNGHVQNAVTSAPIANALVHIYNGTDDYPVNADANGDFSLAMFPGNYSVDAGEWGYHTICQINVNIPAGSPYTIALSPGYYDDFILDFGWSNSGTSTNVWERGVPVGTSANGVPSNPGNDVTGDCGTLCYVTDNGGGTSSAHDVDNGTATLNSPSFDATLYIDPVVKYSRWYFNGALNGNPADDTMFVYLDNGTTRALVETAYPNTSTNHTWVQSTFRIANYLTPSNNMRLIMTVKDTVDANNSASVVEGGLDKFEIVEAVGINNDLKNSNLIAAYPSPFIQNITLHISESVELDNARLTVTDIAGRVLEQSLLTQRTITLGNNYPSGMYFISLENAKGVKTVIKTEKL